MASSTFAVGAIAQAGRCLWGNGSSAWFFLCVPNGIPLSSIEFSAPPCLVIGTNGSPSLETKSSS